MTPLAVLALGLGLGLKHALDADHLIAVSTIVTRERSVWRALWIGLSWGLGHTLALLTVGLIVLGLKRQIPTPVALSLECLVGIVLVGLGVTTLSDWWRKKMHVHAHGHANTMHTHFHTHAESPAHLHSHVPPLGFKPLLIGMIHGLAGSAALMLLVVATIPSGRLGLIYLATFGCGSIFGMGLVTLLMGAFFSLAAERLHAVHRSIQCAIGSLSTVFGVWIVIEIGFIQGLFLG